MSNYPLGAAFDMSAPYNQEDNTREVEVLVSLTISKVVKVKLDDCIVTSDKDEDGSYEDIDCSNCDLNNAVKEQIFLPHNISKFLQYIDDNPTAIPDMDKVMHDISNWDLDDMAVVLND